MRVRDAASRLAALAGMAALGMALAATAACRGSSSAGTAGGAGTPTPLSIAVIPKGATHEHWQRVKIGAEKAAAELTAAGTPVQVIWKGPLREDDREQQIQVVEGFTSQGVKGIVLAPLDSRALKRPVEEAARAGIPTVLFDSNLEPPNDAVSYVATDNGKGGHLAGRRMGELLHGKGTVLMLRYQEGSASTEEREAGFLAELKAGFPGVSVISADQYAGPTRDTAKRAAENLLNRYANRVDGIFTPNESSTGGMLLALQDFGKAGAITFVGFDYSASFLEPLRKGELKGFVVQNPVNMGYLSVKTMVGYLQKKDVPKVVDTGVALVTLDNLQTPEIQAVINPK
jgi:ribose transport system substrate-binding protein